MANKMQEIKTVLEGKKNLIFRRQLTNCYAFKEKTKQEKNIRFQGND